MLVGKVPEVLSREILAGIILVGRSGAKALISIIIIIIIIIIITIIIVIIIITIIIIIVVILRL